MILMILHFISKQKEIFNKLVDEKLEKITDLDEKVNNDDLIYKYKGKFADTKFDEFDSALGINNKIRDGNEDLAGVRKNQQRSKYCLDETKEFFDAKKSKEQRKIYNTEMLYKARNEAIKFYDDYSLMMSEAKTKAKQNETKGTGLKRLPIALAQVKVGNNSENLLNEI